MLTLPCPFCGQRDESEFVNAGPTNSSRPDANVSDAEWVDWLTVPENPIVFVEEIWCHAMVCVNGFTIKGHSVTDEFVTADVVTDDVGKRNGETA